MLTLKHIFVLIWVGLMLAGGWAHADVVVIVHPQCEANTLSKREVINIFMGRYRFFPSGNPARPYDLPVHHPERGNFYHTLTGRDASEIDAYWARLVLTGAASPPLEAENDSVMLEKVARDPYAIGYVNRSRTDKRVRVVFDPSR